MGPLYVQIGAEEIQIVDEGAVTTEKGVTVKVSNGEQVTVYVQEHIEPGPATIRVEVSENGQLEAQAYYGKLPEFGMTDFSIHGDQISVSHQGKER
jgi:hypothetical protein